MLRCVPFFLIVLQLAALDPAAADDARVAIQRRVRWVQTAEALDRSCGQEARVRGCMHLSAELVAGPCRLGPDRTWALASPTIRARADEIRFASRRPFSDGTVTHESAHLRDFRAAFAGHLDDLSRLTFDSEEACRRAGEIAMRAFSADVAAIATGSNRKLHPKRETAAGLRN